MADKKDRVIAAARALLAANKGDSVSVGEKIDAEEELAAALSDLDEK